MKKTSTSAMLSKADHLKQSNQLVDANNIYLEIIKKFPKNTSALRGLAAIQNSLANPSEFGVTQPIVNNILRHINNRDWSTAENLTSKILISTPQVPLLSCFMGVIHAGLENYETAKYNYENAIKLMPNYADAHNNMGDLLNNAGDLQGALTAFKLSTESMPSLVNAHLNMGLVLVRLQRNKEARACFEHALKFDPKNSMAFLYIAKTLEDAKEYYDAIKHYKKVLQLDKTLADAFYNMGNCFKKTDQSASAISSYTNAIQLQPNFAAAHNNLGTVLSEQGKAEDALIACKTAASIDPNHFMAQNNIGNIYRQLGNPETAIPYYIKALELQPNYLDAIENLVPALMQLNRSKEIVKNKIIYESLELAKTQSAYRLFTYLAIDAFIMARYKETKQILSQIDALHSNDSLPRLHPKNAKFVSAYGSLLNNLLTYKNLSLSETYLKENNPSIYHLGESHSLSYAHQTIRLENDTYYVKPKIVFGAKAWHLADTGKNSFKSFLNTQTKTIPDGSPVFISFGEIDCRPDEGIVHHHIKTGEDLDSLITKTISGYVSHTEKLLNHKTPHRYYFSVPAPVDEGFLALHSQTTRELTITTIQLFNKRLKEALNETDAKFVDVYALTSNQTGVSNMQYHCDHHHLAPSILKHIF